MPEENKTIPKLKIARLSTQPPDKAAVLKPALVNPIFLSRPYLHPQATFCLAGNLRVIVGCLAMNVGDWVMVFAEISTIARRKAYEMSTP